MKKLLIEIQYDTSTNEVAHLLLDAFEKAEYAHVVNNTDRYSFTYIRGELQVPGDRFQHEQALLSQAANTGGCW